MSVCARCKRSIDDSSEGSRRIGSAHRKRVCNGCWEEWSAIKDYWWHMWLNPPKDQPRKGLNYAAIVAEREKLGSR